MDDEDDYGFNDTTPEETLIETYENDLDVINVFLDEMDELENWSFSEVESSEEIISFKIF